MLPAIEYPVFLSSSDYGDILVDEEDAMESYMADDRGDEETES